MLSALGRASRGAMERWREGLLRGAGRGQVRGQPFVSAKRFGPYLLVGSGRDTEDWRYVCVCGCARTCNRDRRN